MSVGKVGDILKLHMLKFAPLFASVGHGAFAGGAIQVNSLLIAREEETGAQSQRRR